MACIEKIYSVSALVGTGACNANCDFCAAKDLRPDAEECNPNFDKNLEAAIKLSARYGGWSLSLTSAGEPTVSPQAVTRAMQIYYKCALQGAYFPNVNLFTNGIKLADPEFCERWLPDWKTLGMTNIAVSIHSLDKIGQAKAYGIREYPPFYKVFEGIRRHNLGVRVTLLLRNHDIDNADRFAKALEMLRCHGIDNVTAWPVANPNGSPNGFTPSNFGMFTIRAWLKWNAKLCHGHVWGGGVYDYKGMMVRLTDYVTRHDPKKDYVRQLVVFQDGTVTYSWIKEGALCMK